MAQSANVTIRINAENRGGAAIEGLKRQIRSLGDEAKEVFGSRLTQALSLGALTLGLRQVSKAAAQLQADLTGLASVAQAFGEDQIEAQLAAQSLAADGLMTVGDAATGLKNLLATGFSLPEAITLMERFKDAAAFGRQGSLSFGEAVRSATEGVKNGNSILVDNAGVTKNLSQMLVEAGFSAQDLSRASTDSAVRMAIFKGIVQETAPQLGNVALFANSAAGEMARTSAEMDKAQQIAGLKLQPVLLKLSQGFNKVLLPAIQGTVAVVETFGVAIGTLFELLKQLGIRVKMFGKEFQIAVRWMAIDAIQAARTVPFIGALMGMTGWDEKLEISLALSIDTAMTELEKLQEGFISFANVADGSAAATREVWRNAFVFDPTVTVPSGGVVTRTPPPTEETAVQKRAREKWEEEQRRMRGRFGLLAHDLRQGEGVQLAPDALMGPGRMDDSAFEKWGKALKPIQELPATLSESVSLTDRLGVGLLEAFESGSLGARTLAEAVTSVAINAFGAFGSAVESAFRMMAEGSISVAEAFGNAMLDALASVARGFGDFFMARAAGAVGEGLLGNPIAWGAVAKFAGAATLMYALAGGIGAASAGGGSGGGAAFTRTAATVGEGRGEATLVIDGDFLDLNNARTEQSFKRALETLSGRRVVVRTRSGRRA